jgi:hypothetical protein
MRQGLTGPSAEHRGGQIGPGRFQQSALAEQDLPAAAADLTPQHGRADTGEEDGADAALVVRILEVQRLALDDDAGREVAHCIAVEAGRRLSLRFPHG